VFSKIYSIFAIFTKEAIAMKKLFSASLLAVVMAGTVALASCDKEQMPLTDGTYHGTYTLTSPNGSTQSWDVSLNLSGNKFSLSNNETTRPAYGSIDRWGEFWTTGNKITFKPKLLVVPALYAVLPSLGGECDYTFDGRQLALSRIPQEDESYFGCSFYWSLVKQ
jgi:hypothetical protein